MNIILLDHSLGIGVTLKLLFIPDKKSESKGHQNPATLLFCQPPSTNQIIKKTEKVAIHILHMDVSVNGE